MNITELKTRLRAQPSLDVGISLPGGGRVPAHYHVTEVGHVAKRFVDCGGTLRVSEGCVLQTWIGSPRDDGHRLTAGKLAGILDLAKPVLPTDGLPVEVEYEDGFISQFPLEEIVSDGAALILKLGLKHTDCLAKESCGVGDGCGCTDGGAEEKGCCAGPAGEGCC